MSVEFKEKTLALMKPTKEQLLHLQSRIAECVASLTSIQFEKPEDDAANIRHFIYKQGMMHAFAELARDEYQPPPVPVPLDPSSLPMGSSDSFNTDFSNL